MTDKEQAGATWPDLPGSATSIADGIRGDAGETRAPGRAAGYAHHMPQSPGHVIHDLPVDDTLRRVVVLYRVLGWAWMAILVALTPGNDPEANMTIAGGALALATVWTATTIWAARTPGQLDRTWFVLVDVVVALLVASASTAAGAGELFHGGYPMSTLAVTAYAFNLRMTLVTAGVLAVHQAVVHDLDGRGLLPAVGSVVFIVFAIMLGWAFDNLRSQERTRLAMQDELDRANAAQIRQEERMGLADRLHDSVLQTLAVLQQDSGDPSQVRYLARRQERQLRRTISEYRSPFASSSRAELQVICDDVEELHRITVQSVIRGDAECDETLSALLAATREALSNAAKHAGVNEIDLYAELDPSHVRLFVKDRGHGFDAATTATGRGMDHSLHKRVEDAGGTATVTSAPGEGTEVEITWEAP
jgi:signal transduction histidine kinase